jgi:lipopolysaccharide transport system permease protein
MFFQMLRQWLFAPIVHYRLFHNFVRQDFTGQFAGSFGGMVWLFITPIVNILIYSFVFSVVFRAPMPVEYGNTPFVVFMMMGYLPWFAFGDAMGKASTLLLEKAPLITKVMFPVQIIPAVGTIVPYMVHGIALALFLIYLSTQGYFSLMWLWLPVIFAFQFLFTMGLVAILSALCVFLRDIQQIVTLTMTTWFFLTPIVYPISLIPVEYQPLLLLNPMHHFVDSYRELILLGNFPMTSFLVIIPISLFTYCFGGWIFMRIRHAFGDVL